MSRWPKAILATVCILTCKIALADEGGMSIWLPGQISSFAATPADPGWSFPFWYYHSTADSGSNKTTLRGARITTGLQAKADILFFSPTYVFETPIMGAQASVSLTAPLARIDASVQGSLTGPFGNTLSGSRKDTETGLGDIYGMGRLKWNRGVHNYMGYALSAFPVGSYDPNRLANPGQNHWAIDLGGGYTYLDSKAGHEFSAVLGFTYNFENHDTNYKNGIDAHLDWAASQFLNAQTHVGLVGYFYQQMTGDSGSGALLGDYKSRVYAIGPQAGHFFMAGNRKLYTNFKGYYEFNANNRPEGWNIWLTIVIPLEATKEK